MSIASFATPARDPTGSHNTRQLKITCLLPADGERNIFVTKETGHDGDTRGQGLGHDGMHLENLDGQSHEPHTYQHGKSIDHVKPEIFPQPITPGPKHKKLVAQVSIGYGDDIAGDQHNEIIYIIFQPEIHQGVKTNAEDSVPAADRQIDRHLPPVIRTATPEDVV